MDKNINQPKLVWKKSEVKSHLKNLTTLWTRKLHLTKWVSLNNWASRKLIMKLHGGPKIYLFCSRHPLRILYPRKHWDFKYWTQLLRRLDFEARITKALKTKLNLKQSRCPIPKMKKSMGQLWSSAVDQLYSEVSSQAFITPASSENWRINER